MLILPLEQHSRTMHISRDELHAVRADSISIQGVVDVQVVL